MKRMMVLFFAAIGATAMAADLDEAVRARTAAEIREAVRNAKPGALIVIAPGEYEGGLSFENVHGEPGRPIVIAGADPVNPPVFKGGGMAMHLSDAAHLELRDLIISDMTGNGLNIDDGGSFDTPAHHIVLRNLQIRDIGPKGNRDGIKMSGVDDFQIVNCTIERWGEGGGSGIDMVGCHRGAIEGCTFRHSDTANNSAIQAKGGSSQVTIRRNRFEHSGNRGVNLGGSTGMQFFRPPLKSRAPDAANFEAREIVVEGNTFIGGFAPVAFVNQENSIVRFNTIYRPTRYALRILQETVQPDFPASRNGAFTDNVIAWRSGEMAGAANIGSNTAPETFRFVRNFWYCLDRPDRSRLSLPAEETGGVHGQDPQFVDAEKGDLRLKPGSPAEGKGADALKE